MRGINSIRNTEGSILPRERRYFRLTRKKAHGRFFMEWKNSSLLCERRLNIKKPWASYVRRWFWTTYIHTHTYTYFSLRTEESNISWSCDFICAKYLIQKFSYFFLSPFSFKCMNNGNQFCGTLARKMKTVFRKDTRNSVCRQLTREIARWICFPLYSFTNPHSKIRIYTIILYETLEISIGFDAWKLLLHKSYAYALLSKLHSGWNILFTNLKKA